MGEQVNHRDNHKVKSPLQILLGQVGQKSLQCANEAVCDRFKFSLQQGPNQLLRFAGDPANDTGQTLIQLTMGERLKVGANHSCHVELRTRRFESIQRCQAAFIHRCRARMKGSCQQPLLGAEVIVGRSEVDVRRFGNSSQGSGGKTLVNKKVLCGR